VKTVVMLKGWNKERKPNSRRDKASWTYYNEYGVDMSRINVGFHHYWYAYVTFRNTTSHPGDVDREFKSEAEAVAFAKKWMKEHPDGD
jgi:hypothetical protein